MKEVTFYMEIWLFLDIFPWGFKNWKKMRNVIYEQPQEENLYENRTGAHHYCKKVVFGKLKRFFPMYLLCNEVT